MPGRSGRDEMQGVAPTRSYGAPLGPAAAINAPDRARVGAATATSQHAALEQAGLYRKPVGSQASAPTPVRAPPKPPVTAPPTGVDNPTRDLTVGTAAQRIAQYPARVNQIVDEASK